MLFLLQSYVKFWWKSSNQHGIHSPFVFDLVTQCFYDRKPYAAYGILKNYRQSLLQNRDMIEVTDFGAGSRVFQSNKRAVSKIAQTAGITTQNAKLLFRVAQYFNPDNILEIGTSLGLATSALALGSTSSSITTLEGCPATAGAAQKQLMQFGIENATVQVGEFQSALSALCDRQAKFDFIYFDGNHQKDATLKYFEQLLPTASNDSVWVFDDIHWSPGMEAAWEIIKAHPEVTVTIDTFQWGFVFFRREQEKQHFTIRA